MDTPVLLRLDQIKQLHHLWPRSGVNTNRIAEFAALMKEEGIEALPPIIVCGPEPDGNYALEDGFNRVDAASALGLPCLWATVLPPKSPAELRWAMIGHSATATIPLTNEEKRRQVPLLLQDGHSVSDTARQLGVNRRTIQRWQKDEAEGDDAESSGAEGRANEPSLEQTTRRFCVSLDALSNQYDAWGAAKGVVGCAVKPSRPMVEGLAREVVRKWGKDGRQKLEFLRLLAEGCLPVATALQEEEQ